MAELNSVLDFMWSKESKLVPWFRIKGKEKKHAGINAWLMHANQAEYTKDCWIIDYMLISFPINPSL